MNENTLNFNKKFDNIHDLAVTVGCTQQKNVSDIFEAKATQIPITSEWRGIEALDEGLSQKIMSKKLTEWAIQSFIFRSNYNYDRKYYLTFTMVRTVLQNLHVTIGGASSIQEPFGGDSQMRILSRTYRIMV